MNETDIIRRLGFPDEIDNGGMKATNWKCSSCGEEFLFVPPAPVPSPCPICGGIAFETG